MAKTNTANIGFEKEKIWKAADLLRGNLGASKCLHFT